MAFGMGVWAGRKRIITANFIGNVGNNWCVLFNLSFVEKISVFFSFFLILEDKITYIMIFLLYHISMLSLSFPFSLEFSLFQSAKLQHQYIHIYIYIYVSIQGARE